MNTIKKIANRIRDALAETSPWFLALIGGIFLVVAMREGGNTYYVGIVLFAFFFFIAIELVALRERAKARTEYMNRLLKLMDKWEEGR